jgi:hypothetical protein
VAAPEAAGAEAEPPVLQRVVQARPAAWRVLLERLTVRRVLLADEAASARARGSRSTGMR